MHSGFLTLTFGHGNGLPREVVECWSLEVFKGVTSVPWSGVQGGVCHRLGSMISEVSSLTDTVIL